MIVAGVFLYFHFYMRNSQLYEHSLRYHINLICRFLENDPGGRVRLDRFLRPQFNNGTGKYAIVDSNGALLAASAGLTKALTPIGATRSGDYFVLGAKGDAASYYGLSVKSEYEGRPVWVQVAFIADDIIVDDMLKEFLEDIGWLWVPFVIILLFVNLLVVRIGLAPLRTAASQAGAIGPNSTSIRLSEKGLPRDVHVLVTAVNGALDRLERTLEVQKAFIADAAHELRTPVSILKAHAAILPNFVERYTLVEEIDGLERLVNQLLDSSRLEVLEVKPNETADLNEVARYVAARLGPKAINAGRSIEVIGTPGPVRIHGEMKYLCQALLNIVENAIKHTPERTTVSIYVTFPGAIHVVDRGPGVRPEYRKAIFRRFWQSGGPSGGGAGLGLDIAARITAAHGGTISVGDTPFGGAVFTMRFPASLQQMFSGSAT